MPATQNSLLLQSRRGALQVGPLPVPKPGPGEVLLKVEATALNPVDWKLQAYGIFTEFPVILGTDAAGTIEELGEGVTGFAVGDRVCAQGTFDNVHNSFQQYMLASQDVMVKIPNSLSYDAACTFPVCYATAALGLCNEEDPGSSAGLLPIWEEQHMGKYAGQAFVVIGGATSVGQFVIQLAKLAGFSPIITTASTSNAPFLKSLGATHVVERKLLHTNIATTIHAIAPIVKYVYDTISLADTQNLAYDLLTPGGVMVVDLDDAVRAPKKVPEKRIARVFGSLFVRTNKKTGMAAYAHLNGLLEKGYIKPPRVEVLPNGLAGIPDGLQRLKKNQVSAVKLVARPQETP